MLLAYGKIFVTFGILFLIGSALWYPFKDKARSIIFFLVGLDLLLIGGSCIVFCYKPLGDPSKALIGFTGLINLIALISAISTYFSMKKKY